MWSLKRNDTNELNYRTETDSDLQNKLTVGEVKEFGMDKYTLLCLKWVTNKDLLQNTGHSAQCHVAAWAGGGLGEDGFMSVWLIPFAVT